MFSEAHRILRTGGRSVVAAWLTRERPNPWESKYLLEPICAEGRLPSMASAAEYRTMLEHAGFRDLEFFDLTQSVKKTWSVCALRIVKRFVADRPFRRRLLDRQFTNRVFAKTVFRIWLAYQTGAMRYGVFSALK
jgi:tocopherol O-methyltransferase